jgi:hypothetical protein
VLKGAFVFVTDRFVFLHLPKTAGVYVESVCQENLHMPILHTRRHAKASELPVEHKELPTIGIVRDPWDWYASLYFFAKAERNSATSDLVAIASEGFTLDFEKTLPRLLEPDMAFIDAYESRMSFLGGHVKDFECLDVGSLRRARAANMGLLSFLASEVFPQHLDHVWKYESLRQQMFAFLSPLCVDRVRFRSAMVSPARNASGKPSLNLIYTPAAAKWVEQRESDWIARHGYRTPNLGSTSDIGRLNLSGSPYQAKGHHE